MIKKILSLVVLLGLTFSVFSQNSATSNKAAGIELPADQTVKFDEGFVNIKATCKGTVKWLVIPANSTTKIKYFTLSDNNVIVVSVPPQGGLITVYAVGLVDGKLTDFVKTNITVTGIATHGQTPNNVIAPTMHVTFVVNLNNTTPALGQILNSQKIRETITTRGAYYRLYDSQSAILREKGLDKVIASNGGPPMIIVQAADGNVVSKTKMPGTEAEVLQYLATILGRQ